MGWRTSANADSATRHVFDGAQDALLGDHFLLDLEQRRTWAGTQLMKTKRSRSACAGWRPLRPGTRGEAWRPSCHRRGQVTGPSARTYPRRKVAREFARPAGTLRGPGCNDGRSRVARQFPFPRHEYQRAVLEAGTPVHMAPQQNLRAGPEPARCALNSPTTRTITLFSRPRNRERLLATPARRGRRTSPPDPIR